MTVSLDETPYAGYTYAYPHKTAYRPLVPPVSLKTLWQDENRDALFLYLHVPFCEMRCGFCNLFTTANPKQNFTTAYLHALRRQAVQVREALGQARFARLAIGGGTPTFLNIAELEELFGIVTDLYDVEPNEIPVSVETSPRTAELEKMKWLRERGVDRISMGIQSFIEPEVNASGRAQKTAWVEDALEHIRDAGFPTLNIDLIYGLPHQTVGSWLCSLEMALRWQPEELFLYPLYVRPLTGLGRKAQKVQSLRLSGSNAMPDGSVVASSRDDFDDDADAAENTELPVGGDIRLACYRAGRELLLANGYAQVSMRMFTRLKTGSGIIKPDVAYCCQEDGMVGLGCGARSYTKGLHYASEYAVGATGVRDILRDYVGKPAEAFRFADYGYALSQEEQKRRFVIQSLLQASGLDLSAYLQRFGTLPHADFPELAELISRQMAESNGNALRLTPTGMERSDSIGPWLYSREVNALMQTYGLR